jgi:hypothetical protein
MHILFSEGHWASQPLPGGHEQRAFVHACHLLCRIPPEQLIFTFNLSSLVINISIKVYRETMKRKQNSKLSSVSCGFFVVSMHSWSSCLSLYCCSPLPVFSQLPVFHNFLCFTTSGCKVPGPRYH